MVVTQRTWRTAPGRVGSLGLLVIAIAATAGGCDRAAAPPRADAAPVAESVTTGPVHATISADHDALPVAAPLGLRLEVTAPAGVDVTLPETTGQLGPFRVRDVETVPDVPVASGRRWSRTLRVVTYEAGELEFPGLTIAFTDRRDPNGPAAGELRTQALRIRVASALEGPFDPNEFADIKGAVNLPDPAWPRVRSALVAGAAALAGAGAVLGFLLWRRKRRAKPVPEIPPHEWALAELRRLETENLLARGEVHALYFRLTTIVRQYIERRFGILAAEQTTREFLEAAKSHPALGGAHRPLLTQFLVAGDLVKFALHRPSDAEIRAAFVTARTFVEHTTPRAAPAPPPQPTPRSQEAVA